MSHPSPATSLARRATFFGRKVRYKVRELLLHAWTRKAFNAHGDQSRLLVTHLSPAQREALQNSPSFGFCASGNGTPSGAGLPNVVIVVPFRDKWSLTKNCLESLQSQEAFRPLVEANKLRVVLVDNGSQEEATRAGLEAYASQAPFCVLRVDEPFNFSRLNNVAVRFASSAGFSPEVALFLNNDVSFVDKGDLARLVCAPCAASSVGAVGCTLLYENGCVQHLFLAPGVKIVGAHPLRGMPWAPLRAWREQPWPVAAVTGAVLAVRVNEFLAVGGFDEELATAYQDLDLCLKLQKRGLVNWALGDVVLMHLETATRKASHQTAEVSLMYRRWGAFLTDNAFYSSAFSRWSESPAFARGEGPYPWREYLLLC